MLWHNFEKPGTLEDGAMVHFQTLVYHKQFKESIKDKH